MRSKICSVERICTICGEKFLAKSSRRKRCYKDHYRPCTVCGKPVLVKYASSAITCSENCRRTQIGRTSKIIQSEHRFLCKCRICGDEFYSASPVSSVCYKQHVFTCEYCGKEFYPSRQECIGNKKTCSNECRYKLSNQKFMENIEENIRKMQDGMMRIYGHRNAMQVPELVAKKEQTCLERYGYTSFCKTQEFLDKSMATNRKKYGEDWYQKTDEFKEKSKQTLLLKYDADNYFKSRDFMQTSVTHPELLSNLFDFKANPEKFLSENFDHVPTLKEVSEVVGIVDSSVGYILSQMGKQDLVKRAYSVMEDEVYHFLTQYLSTEEVVRNTRREITPYEIDIFIPSCNFGIECNPTWTHNSTIDPFADDPHDSQYHMMKTDLAEDHDIFLFHLFGHEWKYRRSACENLILNQLDIHDRILIEDLEIHQVPDSEGVAFLDENHLQGHDDSDVKLGLYHQSVLVAEMTFSELSETDWELSRYCCTSNISYLDSAVVLFRKFVIDFEPSSICAVSCRSNTPSSVYQTLGFLRVHNSNPNSVWVNLKTDEPCYNILEQDLQVYLKDDKIDYTQSLEDILVDHGYAEIFDSGEASWIWKGDDAR